MLCLATGRAARASSVTIGTKDPVGDLTANLVKEDVVSETVGAIGWEVGKGVTTPCEGRGGKRISR